jgi:hypothetical protein
MNIAVANLVLLAMAAMGSFHVQAGAPINFVGYKSPSGPIFSKAGRTVLNYQLYSQYVGIHKPGGGLVEDGFIRVVIRDSSGDVLSSYSVPLDLVPSGFGGHTSVGQQYLLTAGSFEFSNPSNQSLTIEEQIWYNRPLEDLAGFPSQEWTSASGQSRVSGGDPTPTSAPASPTQPPPTSTPGGGSIHALIISGRSDPAKIATSPNVTLIGGVVALGKNASSSAKPSSWSPGLRIVPDQNLLNGSKIPPLTPNVIDVRIVKHEVVGDLSIPSASPSP